MRGHFLVTKPLPWELVRACARTSSHSLLLPRRVTGTVQAPPKKHGRLLCCCEVRSGHGRRGHPGTRHGGVSTPPLLYAGGSHSAHFAARGASTAACAFEDARPMPKQCQSAGAQLLCPVKLSSVHIPQQHASSTRQHVERPRYAGGASHHHSSLPPQGRARSSRPGSWAAITSIRDAFIAPLSVLPRQRSTSAQAIGIGL